MRAGSSISMLAVSGAQPHSPKHDIAVDSAAFPSFALLWRSSRGRPPVWRRVDVPITPRSSAGPLVACFPQPAGTRVESNVAPLSTAAVFRECGTLTSTLP